MKATLYNQKAESIGEVQLPERIFGVKPSSHLLAEAVRVQLSSARKGLAHTKTRGEVSGGGKKPWKQKGTGRARAGSTRSPIWRHGGVTFGPRSERNWELKMNKKAKQKALFMSLSDKVSAGKFIVVDRIVLDNAKTKEFNAVLSAFQKASLVGKKPLLVMPKKDEKLHKASRNLPSLNQLPAASLNVADVLKADSIIALKDSLELLEKTFSKFSGAKESKTK